MRFPCHHRIHAVQTSHGHRAGSGPGTVERLQQQSIKRGVQAPNILKPSEEQNARMLPFGVWYHMYHALLCELICSVVRLGLYFLGISLCTSLVSWS